MPRAARQIGIVAGAGEAELGARGGALSNLIYPRCAERAKPGQGKPVLIIHIGFLA